MTWTYFTDRDLGNQFPKILKESGLSVISHSERFQPHGTDEEWLEFVGGNGLVAVSHNLRIRYTPNEVQAVDEFGVRLLIVRGKGKFAEMADWFVKTVPKIERFLESHAPPFIAKVHAPTESDCRKLHPSGRVELWHKGKAPRS